MSRRKRVSPALWAAPAAVIAVAAIGFNLLERGSDPARTTPPLNVSAYCENPRAFAGNSCSLEARVLERLAKNDKGAVYALAPEGGSPQAVVVPSAVAVPFNIEKGQLLVAYIRVSDEGFLVANRLSKK